MVHDLIRGVQHPTLLTCFTPGATAELACSAAARFAQHPTGVDGSIAPFIRVAQIVQRAWGACISLCSGLNSGADVI